MIGSESQIFELAMQRIDRHVEELVEARLNSVLRSHLEEIIRVAKDEAVKQIAAKLLKCALE